jgi:hypothetical protein
VGSRKCRSFNAPNRVVKVRPRVGVGVAEGAAVIMTGQTSEVEEFSGLTKRLSVFSKRFFWVLMPVFSVHRHRRLVSLLVAYKM